MSDGHIEYDLDSFKAWLRSVAAKSDSMDTAGVIDDCASAVRPMVTKTPEGKIIAKKITQAPRRRRGCIRGDS